uniref:G-protein coupled receptors family 1 profile domain-containing protein n=1 Tax=Oryzias sinensis TaxID=183150 RepID=A0A8C7WWS3_9TELE
MSVCLLPTVEYTLMQSSQAKLMPSFLPNATVYLLAYPLKFYPDDLYLDVSSLICAVVFGLGFLVGVPGNIAVIILNRNIQHLSPVNQSLMLSLAVLDLLFLLTVPFLIYGILYIWTLGDVASFLLTYLSFVSIYGSQITVTLISVQRYLVVVKQLNTLNNFGPKRLLVLLWTVFLIAPIPFCIALELTVSDERIDQLWMVMLITEIIWGFIIMFIVAFSYICLYRKLKQAAFFDNPQTTRLVISITVSFFVLYFPYHVNNILTVIAFFLKNKNLMENCDNWWYISVAIVSLNSSVNPYLYHSLFFYVIFYFYACFVTPEEGRNNG